MKAPLEDLPPPTTTRWTIRRKAAIVVAVRSGRMTIEEVCHTYQLSEEEFLSWARAFETYSFAGLRTTRTRILIYRRRGRARVPVPPST